MIAGTNWWHLHPNPTVGCATVMVEHDANTESSGSDGCHPLFLYET